MIGEAIRRASHEPMIRQHAAQLAASVEGHKDYLGQLRAIYEDFRKRWRYVRDPVRQELIQGGKATGLLTLGFANPHTHGYGDCDDATIALAAQARSIGLEPRLVVMSAPNAPGRPSHIYPEVEVPHLGWIPADAVAAPTVPFGAHPPAGKRWRFDLYGKQITNQGAATMHGLGDANRYDDHDLAAYGLAGTDGAEPESWSNEAIAGFGYLADEYGINDNPGLLAEVDTATEDGLAITPMLELSLGDYQYVQQHGTPYVGMTALSEDGDVLMWDVGPDGLGFFKKLFKAVKRGVKKIRKKARRLIKKLPGGKYLVKIGDKIRKVTRKLVKPLARALGPMMRKLAPVAALVPGYGTAAAGALTAAGQASRFVEGNEEFGAFPPRMRAARMMQLARMAQRRPVRPGHIPAGTPEHMARIAPMLPAAQAQRMIAIAQQARRRAR